MVVAGQGFGLMKLFPADAAGGLAWLKAVAAPLAGLSFCPTGGIGADTAQSYLSLANVACVGGSWVAPRDLVARGEWGKSEQLAAAASQLKRF
jgi:2-dehydro-3-deoxyphosphogluconate aldolase/(4S)-4-hydroxy-2-oxoglutarate aldolase